MKDEDLTVTYEDVTVTISKDLLDKQNAWDNLGLIKALHRTKLILYSMLEEEVMSDFKIIDAKLTYLEFELQDAWGFARSKKYHKFWERPQCICPKMDNNDRYPCDYYIVNTDCPLHGNKIDYRKI